MADAEADVDSMGEGELRQALLATRNDLKVAKGKMSSWKDKMKDIIEKERAELGELRSEKVTFELRVESLEQEVATLKQERDLREDPVVRDPDASDAVLRDSILRLEAEKKTLQEDYDRFKERTNVAMKLRGKELASKQNKHSTLEEDLRNAQAELATVKEELGLKEVELDRMEEQAAQASLSVSRQLEMASRENERAKTVSESEKLGLVAKHREALQELKDATELQHSDTVRMYEQELAQLSLKIDEAEANVVSNSQVRVDQLVRQTVTLQGELESARDRIKSLEDSATRQQVCVKEDPESVAVVRELKASVRRLTDEKDHQSQRLFVLQQELIEAKDAAGELKSRYQTEADLSEVQQRSYLKQIVMSFLTSKSDDVRQSLVPILATLLQLSANELKQIYLENPTWSVT
eukprot:TRINITY_DN10648_c0_g1_i3.p1 TRINITY_DN10648_c0_g1~~TRINITY_DN10648_c0_g1_i3.p1  ORF type:complete len:410 (+),score=146.56 TRINITY_DN10648_c0_g1_i3:100-1329(+)